MEVALLFARWLLAAVFGVAGLAKLSDQTGARRNLSDFGVPIRLVRLLAVCLPLLELAVALALITAATTRWAALAALVMVLLFIGAISLNMARGRRPECRCFGQLHAAPVGWRTLARNMGLACVAGFVFWQGQDVFDQNLAAWPQDFTAKESITLVGAVVGIGLLTAMAMLLVQVLGQQGRILLRIEKLEEQFADHGAQMRNAGAARPQRGPPVGSVAPELSLLNIDGKTVTLHDLLRSQRPLLLIFIDPECRPCNALLPDIRRWQRDLVDKVTVACISRRTDAVNRTTPPEHGLPQILLQLDNEATVAYKVYGTPSGVLISVAGLIGGPIAEGSDAIRAQVTRLSRPSNYTDAMPRIDAATSSRA
jgi:peroxiredoxin